MFKVTYGLGNYLERIRRDGWCVVEDVIPADEVVVIRDHVSHATEKYGRDKAAEKGIGHVPGFIRHDQSYAPYLADAKLMAVFEALIGQFVKVSFTTATINLPGNVRGGWHADWPFNQRNAGHVPAPYPDVIMHLTTLWMLSPFTEENGGTLIVPGSHRWPDNPTGGVEIDP